MHQSLADEQRPKRAELRRAFCLARSESVSLAEAHRRSFRRPQHELKHLLPVQFGTFADGQMLQIPARAAALRKIRVPLLVSRI